LTVTVAQWLQRATDALARHSPSARLDAEVLVMYACGLNRTELLTRAESPLTPAQSIHVEALIARRGAGEPVAYITGRREFWSLDLGVTRATLIPRPDTETLVEQALALIPDDASWRVADLGTGSGAIALALAHERPRCRIVATDISAPALAVARGNATRLGLHTVEWRQGSWQEPLGDECFDMIVSNPPYVRDDDPHLDQGDLRFEPAGALRAGHDGLDALRHLAHYTRPHLRPGGWLLLEHGYDQGAAVRQLLADAGYADVQTHIDYGGQERLTQARMVC
jgi:release factor glutamine methyltransferase